jgi:hypothetical protein
VKLAAMVGRTLWIAAGASFAAMAAPRAGRSAWQPVPVPVATHDVRATTLDSSPAAPALPRWLTRLAALPVPWTVLALSSVGALAIASRLRYVLAFHGVYGSGDANLELARALAMKDGMWHPPSGLVLLRSVFDQPPLIPALLASVSRTTGLTLDLTPLVVVPILTTAALLVLTRLLARIYGWPTALAAAALIALLPRLSFDSTEPDKAPFVVSFFIFSLAALYAGVEDRRFLLVAGFCIGLAMLAHTTAYLFLPVLALSYVALHARSLRSALNRYAAGALVFPLLAVIVYFALAHAFRPPPLPQAQATGPSDGLLPGFVQTYVDASWALLRGGFGDSAAGIYITAIRTQLGMPIFLLACAGAATSAYQVLFYRQWKLAAPLLWAAIITLAFALQYPASSHASRYPSYVTPVHLILAMYFVATLAQHVGALRVRHARLIASASVVGVVAYAAASYAFAPEVKARAFYAPHPQAADYVTSRGLLDDGAGMLYLDWPSITFPLLEARPDYADQLVTFGFGQRSLDTITPEFVREHHLQYYLYDHTGNDSFHSADVVMTSLASNFVLQEIARFGSGGSYATLYRVQERSAWTDAGAARFLLADLLNNASPSVLVNGALCPDAFGGIPRWDANGWVNLRPQPHGLWPCGVVVENRKEFGGVQQEIGSLAPGQAFTLVAAIRAADQRNNPARTAIAAVYSGSRTIAQSHVSLATGESYIVLEGYAPLSGGALRLILCTGAGDAGDMGVDGILVEPGLAPEVMPVAAGAGSE